MLHAETIKKLADVLKLDVSTLTASLKSDKEETLEVPVLYTEDDKNSFGENRFKEGKKAASEILVKDLKVKHGLEFEGKSIDTLFEKYSEKVIADAKINPDEKVTKYKTENETLKARIQEAETKLTTKEKEFNDKMFHVETKNQIFAFLPDNTNIPKEDLAELFMLRHSVKKEDNGVVVYKGDQALKDNVLNPIALKDVVKGFAETYIKKNGMGGGDNGGGGATGKFKTMSQYMDHCKNNGIEPMSDAGLKLLKENKDAAFDENK